MENLMEITCVPIIITIIYGILELYKHFFKTEKWLRLIPLWAAILGIILGIISYYIIPEIMPADNLLVAILIGGASGLAATGTNQIYKQLTKEKKPK